MTDVRARYFELAEQIARKESCDLRTALHRLAEREPELARQVSGAVQNLQLVEGRAKRPPAAVHLIESLELRPDASDREIHAALSEAMTQNETLREKLAAELGLTEGASIGQVLVGIDEAMLVDSANANPDSSGWVGRTRGRTTGAAPDGESSSSSSSSSSDDVESQEYATYAGGPKGKALFIQRMKTLKKVLAAPRNHGLAELADGIATKAYKPYTDSTPTGHNFVRKPYEVTAGRTGAGSGQQKDGRNAGDAHPASARLTELANERAEATGEPWRIALEKVKAANQELVERSSREMRMIGD